MRAMILEKRGEPLLPVELFLLWFPFGKLMHAGLAFWSRGITGVKYGRRGAMP